MYILAQIIGGIGIIVTTVGMLSKQKKNILLAQAITNICFVIQYAILGAITGAIMYIVNTTRAVTFYIWDKKEMKPSILLLALFILLAIGLGIYTYKDIFSLLAIIGSIATTYGGWQKSSKILRIGVMISCSVLILHDLHFEAYTGMLIYIMCFVSSLIGLIKHDIFKNKANR